MFLPVFVLTALILFNQNIWSQTILSSVNVSCTVNYDGHLVKKGESINMKGKFYNIEDCSLHRTYHACGSQLLYIFDFVCESML